MASDGTAAAVMAPAAAAAGVVVVAVSAVTAAAAAGLTCGAAFPVAAARIALPDAGVECGPGLPVAGDAFALSRPADGSDCGADAPFVDVCDCRTGACLAAGPAALPGALALAAGARVELSSTAKD